MYVLLAVWLLLCVSYGKGVAVPRIDLWFLSISSDSKTHQSYAKLAILSNKLIGKVAQPVVMMDGENPPLQAWFEKQEVIVLHPQLPFLDNLRNHSSLLHSSMHGKGVSPWMRLCIPDVTQDLKKHPKIVSQNLSTDFVLYTDVDVFFYRKFAYPKEYLKDEGKIEPIYMAHAIQGDQYASKIHTVHFNSGVSIINVKNMLTIVTKMQEAIFTSKRKYPTYDQSALHQFLPLGKESEIGAHSTLLSKKYNWEPYLGPNEAAYLIHWHGPKITMTEELCTQYQDGYRIADFILEDSNSRPRHKYHRLLNGTAARAGYAWALGYLSIYAKHPQFCDHLL